MYTIEVVSRPNLCWRASDLDRIAGVSLGRTMRSDLHVIFCYQVPDEGVLDACITELDDATGLGRCLSYYYSEHQPNAAGQ